MEMVEEAGTDKPIEEKIRKALEDLGLEIHSFTRLTNYPSKVVSAGEYYSVKVTKRERYPINLGKCTKKEDN